MEAKGPEHKIAPSQMKTHLAIIGPVDPTPFLQEKDWESIPECKGFPLIGQLAREARKNGFRVSIFTLSSAAQKTMTFESEVLGGAISICPQRPNRTVYDFYREERAHLAKAMVEARCDVIHAHWNYEYGASALDASEQYGSRTIITAHDYPLTLLRHYVPTKFWPFWATKALMGLQMIRRAPEMTVVSPEGLRQLSPLRKGKKTTLIPNGVTNEIISLGEERTRTGKDREEKKLFAIMDGFGMGKNAECLLRGFQLIRERQRDVSLHIFGRGYEDNGPAHAWAQKRGIRTSGVKFQGRTEHAKLMEKLAEEADVLIHPSLDDSFGMAPLEAMACGVPVIGHHLNKGVRHVLGKTGVLTDMENPQAIRKTALELLGNKEKRRDLAEAGWKRAKEEFSLEAVGKKYAAQYRNEDTKTCPPIP
jgi:L-malate glycosyltransferase